MNSRTKKRRKTIQGNSSKLNLNISKIKLQSNLKKSISSRIYLKNENYYNSRKIIIIPFYQKRIEQKKLPKRFSQAFLKTNIQKYYQSYNLKANENIINEKKDISYTLNKSTQINKIEKKIKRALHNMRKDIENNTQIEKNIFPEILINKKISSPNLKAYYKIKKTKKDLGGSSIIQGSNILNSNLSFREKYIHKRSKSYDFTEQFRKKLYRKIKKKIFKQSNKNLNIINNSNSYRNNSSSEDFDYIKENNSYFSFDPNSNFIFIFDLLLIFSDLYTFIVIPLNAAKNMDIREKGSIYMEIIHYIIDLIFLLDFILSFFKGYYNYEMKIVRKNTKIIINY